MPEHHPEIKSTAAVFGHPIHPMLIPFPIASLVGALVTDIVAIGTDRDPFWVEASSWLLLAGIITGVVAAVFGLIDFATIRKVRDYRASWVHFLGNAIVLILAAINFFMRIEGEARELPDAGLILSVLTTALLGVTGWLGGEMSYRYKIGVIPDAGDLAEDHLRTHPSVTGD